VAGLISNLMISPDSQKLGAATNISVYFKTANPLVTGNYF